MKPPSSRFLSGHVLLVGLYLFVAAAAGTKIERHERATSELIRQIALRQNLNNVTNMDVNLDPGRLGKVVSFLLKVTNKDFTNEAKAAATRQEIYDSIDQLQREIFASASACFVLLLSSLLFLGAGRLLSGPALGTTERLIYDLLAVSLVFFVVGISCPVLTASVKGQQTLIGGFVIETDSKGIISTVLTLFRSKNWMISALLAAFSIGIPIFKGVAVVVTLLQRSAVKRERVGRFLELIGKWSLTDVLVAAVFLGIFSLNAIKNVDGGVSAVPRFALGFFIGYCILAAFTSNYLRRTAKHAATPPSRGRSAAAAAVTVLALAGGAAFGYRVPFNLLHADEAGPNTQLVKLVRTSAQLVDAKFEVRPGHPALVSFAVALKGALAVIATAHGQTPLTVAVFADGVGPAAPAEGMKGFPQESTLSYRHAAEVAPGQYHVVISTEGSSNESVLVAVSLDP